ncbi:pyridoxal phosphate-dependent decarboxylase family protein [Aureitalea marina]|uniref:L-2,4-diaminobutyrate decarboxylase n=1 Tax=Aureitalea marina TaxID=930804 RepID=A0A2S7KTT5_9FLAO|nr:aminotransferase class V-fold PLP-dependent enzyme [Aureitalea marina]PQB06052.1 L-2,4-diaminobutyrate decarboxylase [Aureitalea marina]
MNSLRDQIRDLEKSSSRLEPNTDKRDKYLQQVHQYANSFIEELDHTPTFSAAASEMEDLGPIDQQINLQQLLSIYKKKVATKGINPASGGHLGYIPGGGIYLSAVGDYLADITNEYSGIHYASPGAVNIENQLIDWMKSIFGFPESAIGNLASGGSIANLIALTAARDRHKIKGEKIERSVIYLSPQVHHCINKALRIIGLEDIHISYIDLDDNHRMDPNDLSEKIEEDKTKGLNPFLVIASAGTTDTGAIDPLDNMADLAKKHKLWFHVDGAYGGFFILCDSKKEQFQGIEKADSIVIDPHKSLFLPYGLGAVLVKDKEAVYHSNHYTANYMQDARSAASPVNPADVSPELTKHFRGLRLWLPLKIHGIEPFVACLEEKLLLTQYFREKLGQMGFQLGPEPDLSVSYFWYPAKGDQNQFNRDLLKAIHQDGRVFLSSTMIGDRFVIRMAILAFRTKLETIDLALEMIHDCLSAIKAK